MECEEQITTDWQKTGPPPGVNTPLTAIGAVELFPSFAVETNSCGLHVTEPAVLSSQVSVATQGDMIALDLNNAMQDVVLGGYLSQDGITYINAFRLA